jgi:hypothetical protein
MAPRSPVIRDRFESAPWAELPMLASSDVPYHRDIYGSQRDGTINPKRKSMFDGARSNGVILAAGVRF